MVENIENEINNQENERPVKMMLTTTDNPFDPFDQFDKWYAWDEANGYHTCAYLARIAKISTQLSETDQNTEINRAIEEIAKLNITGNYKKVTRQI